MGKYGRNKEKNIKCKKHVEKCLSIDIIGGIDGEINKIVPR
jgi:hypothetical protein